MLIAIHDALRLLIHLRKDAMKYAYNITLLCTYYCHTELLKMDALVYYCKEITNMNTLQEIGMIFLCPSYSVRING